MSGEETFNAMRRNRPEARVLLMSGYTNEEVVRAGVSSSEAAFIQKPFTRRSLSKVLRKVFDG